MRNLIVSKADTSSCFGWVQNHPNGESVVGEIRCNKRVGPILQDWIELGPYTEISEVSSVETRIYEDTKIKLHFAYFKTLEGERVTCFRDLPHRCEEFGGGGDEEKDPFVKVIVHQQEGGKGGEL